MKFFDPITANGKKVNLPTQFLPLKLLWFWPVDYNCPPYLERIYLCLAVLLYICTFPTVFAECAGLAAIEGDVISISEGLCTTLVGGQYILRGYHLITCRRQLRNVLKNFYRDIYIDSSENKKLHESCERSLRWLYVTTSSFLLPLAFMFIAVIMIVVEDPDSRSKPFFYRMNFFYDAQEPWLYALTTLFTSYGGFSAASLMLAEDSFLGTLLCYTGVRYEQLNKELENLYQKSVRTLAGMPEPLPPNALHRIFISKLKAVVRKQQQLDRFAAEMQDCVSPIVFTMVVLGVLLLCVIAFMLAKTDFSLGMVKYFIWLMCQNLEFMIIGFMAQRYTDGASEMANSFYMCNWESLLPHGTSEANARLIRSISFAIYRSQKSVHLDGLKFFTLSLSSIGSAVSSSVSYFMFLNTMEDITNKKNTNN